MSDQVRKKVLILTYYWPPSGGAGVQRWLKFTKYLRDFNFEPLIYTAEDPEYPSIDESLFRDIPENITILKKRVWEPYTIYKWFTFQKKGHRVNAGFLNKDKKKGPGEKISVWIRGNLFIPDARRFWIRPSVRYLSSFLDGNPVDLIVSTGPPHSLHLIAAKIAKKMNLPWVADFRDPWTKIDYYQDLMLGARADRKHHKLEKEVINSANVITVISNDMKRQFEEMGVRNVEVVPNGFDPDDFPDSGGEPDNSFSITHIGSIVPSRNPDIFWEVISELVSENGEFAADLEIKLVGDIDYSVSESIRKQKLTDYVTYVNYMPHLEVAGILKRSQVLLLLINNTPNAKGILTGKFFEYMSTGRPILAIGPPDGEAGQILKETGTGSILDFSDRENLKKKIIEYYSQFKKGNLKTNPENTEKYSRKTLTRDMSKIFTKTLSSK